MKSNSIIIINVNNNNNNNNNNNSNKIISLLSCKRFTVQCLKSV